MTCSQYWDGEPGLFQAYREARRLDDERRRWARWELGEYIYDVLGRMAPIFNPFSKARVKRYVERPYGIEEEKEPPAQQEALSHERMASWLMKHGPSR